jgi:hypothetical protein
VEDDEVARLQRQRRGLVLGLDEAPPLHHEVEARAGRLAHGETPRRAELGTAQQAAAEVQAAQRFADRVGRISDGDLVHDPDPTGATPTGQGLARRSNERAGNTNARAWSRRRLSGKTFTWRPR